VDPGCDLKQIVITILNGGFCIKKNNIKIPFLISFLTKLIIEHKQNIQLLSKHDYHFSEEYTNISPQLFNFLGKSVSYILNLLENIFLSEALLYISTFLKKKNLIVTPIYDGFLLLKEYEQILPSSYIEDLSAFVGKSVGFQVQFLKKKLDGSLLTFGEHELGTVPSLLGLFEKEYTKIPKEFRTNPINEPKRSVNTSQK
jgi:hypothetical protein